MNTKLERRSLLKVLAFSLGAAAASGLQAAAAEDNPMPVRKLKIGYTCITWGSFPHPGDDTTLEAALGISGEGFWSFETFPEVLDNWDQRGLLKPLIAKYGIPLKSGYISCDLIDPSKRKDETARITQLSKTVQKFGGTFVVLAGKGIKRDSYKFQEHRADIISALNDYAAAVTGLGLATGLHQHTGTPVETRDEVYAVMESVNTQQLEVRSGCRATAEGGGGRGKGREGFPAAGEAYALEGLQGLAVLRRLLSVRYGSRRHQGNSRHGGGRGAETGHHGGTGPIEGRPDDATPDRTDKQSLPYEAGL